MKHEFFSLAHPTKGVASQQFVYRDVAGNPVLVANRYNLPDGGKYFLPYDVAQGKWKALDLRPIYNLDKVVSADPSTPIILVEGEKCADALTALGYLATTTFGGSNGWKKADLSPLHGRRVYAWGDQDDAGQKYVLDLTRTLGPSPTPTPGRVGKSEARLIPISASTLHEITGTQIDLVKGWDVADFLDLGFGRTEIDALLEMAAPKDIGDEAVLGKGDTRNSPSQKSTSDSPNVLDGMELWRTPQDETYATLRRDGHFEHWPTASRTFQRHLAYAHFQTEGKVPSATALEDRRRMLEGEALFGGETHPVFSRIASIGRTIYLDLGDASWQAVAITAEGWQVVTHPMTRFRRSPSTDALPVPERHSDGIELLRPFLNVKDDDDFRMLVAWVVGCFHPKGPYPILILSGEQGSAKSTTAQILRSLVDPANPSTRSTPSTEQDLVIAAKHNHVLSFDNLSNIRPMMADAFCRIATGGGFGTRKLHTDTDEVLFNATRPCLLNGIPDLAARPDLADRSIGVTLPVISSRERRTLGSFNRDFAKAAPFILGALLDAVSTALSRIDSVSLSEAPRMADFAKWVVAAAPALGWPEGAFLDSYAANRETSDQSAIENNPVALAILRLMGAQKHWEGTATDLKQTLRQRFPALTDDPYSFPRQENKLSAALRRVQPPLRRRGIALSFERRGKSGERLIQITTI
ncbi:hypothetical protein [Parasedimentitalea psychrophila]|uniref:ATP-binding protein n=1 Tax=Parasedimentitalea psychrophila TaxID=2997337 RepID=A0A9Y2P7M6_9RHOB|nr:hypothetical protein [Parasedimentitalea psychrophila]WIY25980.1 hypothetical protein QPJ95_03325 [Parasedimentitalea psychrophila]